jgi:hypothetical protein
MPHLFVNRHRAYDLITSSEKAGRTFVWESVNAILYVLGGLTFVVGSVFFFPALGAEIDWGVWAFFIGSILYLVVTLHDMLEVLRYGGRERYSRRGRRLEILAASGYLLGTVLFLVGSAFFFTFIGLIDAGAWCFIIGSVLFTVSAFVNVLQIHHGDSSALKLYNLTAVTFVAGAVLFTTASIPYLWHAGRSAIAVELFVFLAAQYLVGSVLFFAGGLFNYRRAWILVLDGLRHHRDRHKHPKSKDAAREEAQ